MSLKWLISLLSKIATVTADYLNLQIAAGVNAIQIFDSWAQALAWDDYKEFSHRYITEIISKLNRKDIPVISFLQRQLRFRTADGGG